MTVDLQEEITRGDGVAVHRPASRTERKHAHHLARALFECYAQDRGLVTAARGASLLHLRAEIAEDVLYPVHYCIEGIVVLQRMHAPLLTPKNIMVCEILYRTAPTGWFFARAGIIWGIFFLLLAGHGHSVASFQSQSAGDCQCRRSRGNQIIELRISRQETFLPLFFFPRSGVCTL